MISARKLAANRANARKSTGPRTADGKARSCLARRHPRQVFGDMTDTSYWHGFGFQGGPTMPWQEVSIMEQRREFIELAMQEGANRRELCRRFGIHPATAYKWLGRWAT